MLPWARTFRLSDRFNLDLRVDATNALNHVTFTAWNTTVNSPQFGLPAAANAMRSMQTTLRAEVLNMRRAIALFFYVRSPAGAQQIGQNAPARSNGTATFTTSTQLVVETVAVKDKKGKPDRRLDRAGFHSHRRRRAADDPFLRTSETAGDTRRPPAVRRCRNTSISMTS